MEGGEVHELGAAEAEVDDVNALLAQTVRQRARDGRRRQGQLVERVAAEPDLFGGTAEDIEFGLRNGRQGKMPAWADILGEQRAHLVATYVYSLSQDAKGGQ